MRIWNPWQGLTKRKLLRTLAIVAVLSAFILLTGPWLLERSEPYELGREAVGARLSVPVTSIRLKRFGEIEYAESGGGVNGDAHFVLCSSLSDKCFVVAARKRESIWKVVDLQEER